MFHWEWQDIRQVKSGTLHHVIGIAQQLPFQEVISWLSRRRSDRDGQPSSLHSSNTNRFRQCVQLPIRSELSSFAMTFSPFLFTLQYLYPIQHFLHPPLCSSAISVTPNWHVPGECTLDVVAANEVQSILRNRHLQQEVINSRVIRHNEHASWRRRHHWWNAFQSYQHRPAIWIITIQARI